MLSCLCDPLGELEMLSIHCGSVSFLLFYPFPAGSPTELRLFSSVCRSCPLCPTASQFALITFTFFFFFYLETFNLLPKVLDSCEQPLPSKFFKTKEAWKANFVSNNSTVAWVYFYIETCFVNSSFSVCSLSAFAFLGRRPRSSEENKAWFLHMKWSDRQLQLCLEKLAEVILLLLNG